MAIDPEELQKLHDEAKRIRKNFRYIVQDLKRSPENIDLLKQRDHLRKRYDQIQSMLRDAKVSRSDAVQAEVQREPEPSIDMSIFEPKPFEIPAAVPLKQRANTPRSGESFLTAKNIRMVIALALLCIVLPFFYLYFLRNMRFYEVPTRSMEPTLMSGDRIVALQPIRYSRGDIVVLTDPQSPGDFLVKRAVAFENDVVEVVNGKLFVNNQPIDEQYIAEAMEYTLGPFTVKSGEVYLLGDNRNESEDSHIWSEGKPISELVGRVIAIYSPSPRRGWLPDYRDKFADVKDAV